MKKKYAFAGASCRAYGMYMCPLHDDFADTAELVGVYDINIGRSQLFGGRLGIPVYDNFDEMIAQAKPDVVIVTTVDVFHSDYIIRAMELGCDVITEKPMTTTIDRINAIRETEKRTGRKLTVTFNYRFDPLKTKIKALIKSGLVGDIFSVHFEWLLDRNMDVCAHGTSYFRRWNARIEKSGGLLVHKATHHFDLINWWIDQTPKRVSAFGKLNLYGLPGREKYANGMHGENCRLCSHAKECGFYYKLTEDEQQIYAANEHIDGYYKDGCVYAPDIDIYDTMAVNVEYDGGALLTYSLNATCAYEGWHMYINGSKGRLEIRYPETGVDAAEPCNTIRFYDLDNNVTEYHVTKVVGGHGGGDERLRDMIFKEGVPDPLGHQASSIDGAKSVAIGAAANISIREKRQVDIDSLVKW